MSGRGLAAARAIPAGLLVVLAACQAGTPAGAPLPGSPGPGTDARPGPAAGTEEPATLVRVVDGDTVVVRVGGREERVRLIGIDTPERDECFFRQASDHLARLLGAGPLRLVRDVSERDRYGRLLRYLWAGGVFVNARMVADGYAHASTFPPDVAHAEELRGLQREARAASRGLWAPGACP